MLLPNCYWHSPVCCQCGNSITSTCASNTTTCTRTRAHTHNANLPGEVYFLLRHSAGSAAALLRASTQQRGSAACKSPLSEIAVPFTSGQCQRSTFPQPFDTVSLTLGTGGLPTWLFSAPEVQQHQRRSPNPYPNLPQILWLQLKNTKIPLFLVTFWSFSGGQPPFGYPNSAKVLQILRQEHRSPPKLLQLCSNR